MTIPTLLFLAVISFFMICECLWSLWTRRTISQPKEVMANLALLLGNQLIRPLTLAWKLFVLSLLEPLQLFQLPVTPATMLLTFLAVEFLYYWYHRLSHEIPFLWAIHHTHHSGSHMNLTTAVRLNWLGGFVSIPFFLPLVLLGFSPNLIVLSLAVNLLFQFFLHTEAVTTLGKLEGLLFNTPSAHRVHHGSNPAYIDKNYGGFLIIFDRIFGTWQPEGEKVRYGVTTGPVSRNPFVIVFHPLLLWACGAFHREKKAQHLVAQSQNPLVAKPSAASQNNTLNPGRRDEDQTPLCQSPT